MGGIYLHSRIGKTVVHLQEDSVSTVCPPRGLFFGSLGTLGAVFGTGLHSAVDALCIESSAHDMITHAGDIPDTAAADENN